MPPAVRNIARYTGIRSVLKLLYADTGFIVNFETLKKACAKLHETIDHNFLNEIPGLETPSSLSDFPVKSSLTLLLKQ